jgi:quercetin dioxygenase-like cupin family protein
VVHAGHEIVFCIQGSIEYVIDNERFLIREGEFLLFEAQLPHIWHNPGEEKSQFLLILENSSESSSGIQRHFSGYPSLGHMG